ncbi:hypothetical protein HPC38_05015 [Pasteurellaceae bacterium HPA106]|uniref:hypothetical protein n=1 Tax=Spirabiliibacterium pneumoniae TaxID=221400 RepID=UPI001AADB6F7|nr:hypothetical protein [Spirabiliibacterium pneumoniae]MBE2896235.1 hypothetical protein [Spirabiliibacterium pneumoniae]
MNYLDFDAMDNLINKLEGIIAGLDCVAFGLDGSPSKAINYFALELEALQSDLQQAIKDKGKGASND